MGFLSSIGGALNDITGASSSSHKAFSRQARLNNQTFEQQKALDKMSYAEQEKLLKMQQAYDTQMANTAVQRQMNDYMKSGINPAMVVAGQGASTPMATAPSTASGNAGGGGSTSAPTSGIDLLGTAINAYSAKKAGETGDTQSTLNISQANKNDAETAEIMEKMPYVKKQIKANIENTIADTVNKRTNSAKTTAGRWAELGLPIGEQISNFFNTPAKGNGNNKKIHWYGTRKDGH